MTYRFGEFELDEERRQLLRGTSEVSVQPLVFNLIALLVRNHTRVVTKNELLDALWPDVTVTEASIQRAISLARTVLNDKSHELIRTFTSYGYRFCDDVQVESTFGKETTADPAAVSVQRPRIQYVTTKDGVSIAYWTLGEGPPLVYVPNVIWSHGQLEWEIPEMRRWYQKLAHKRTLVRFDPRGTGSSQRELAHYSFPALQLDVEAVVDRLELRRFALFGDLNAGPVVLRFAAEVPERVSRLVLWHSYTSTRDLENPKMVLDSLQPLIGQDWETFTEMRAHMGVGWLDGEAAHRYAAFMRECITPKMAAQSYEAGHEDDVAQLLPRIKMPVLVLHRRQYHFWDIQVSRNLASRLSNARLAVLEGAGSAPFLGDSDQVVDVIDSFLNET